MPKVSTVMSFDYGTRRVGSAIGNSLTQSGQPLKTISATNSDALFQEIESLLKEWQPDQLVVGKPLHPDGTAHDITAKALRFGNQLHGRFHIPVTWVDERYSSAVLDSNVEMQDNLDAHSAVLILEQYFAEQNSKSLSQ